MPGKKSPSQAAGPFSALDALLARCNPKAAAAMNPGASAAAVAKLAARVGGGKPLPPGVAAFFLWHNGQSRPARLWEGDARAPLSIEDALEAREFLCEEKPAGWSATWLPLFANGSGDYLVCELAGDNAGALVGYWHADPGRKVEFPHLDAWAAALQARLTAEAIMLTALPPAGKFAIDASATTWKSAKSPTAAALAKKPLGAAMHFRRRYFSKPVPFWVVFVKVGANDWRFGQGSESLEAAIGKITDYAGSRKRPSDYEWKRDDEGTAEALRKKEVERDLKDYEAEMKKWKNDHVGLFEGQLVLRGTIT